MYRCAIYLMFSVLTARAALFQSYYFADTDLDGTVFYDTLLLVHRSDSLALCFAMCGQNCHCLGYNSQKKRYHLYKSCDSVNKTDYDTEWRYYNSKLEGECSTWWHCCSHWIGANDIEQEGRFVWTENNHDVTSYSNWYPSEPDNAWVGDCVHICRGGIWGDYNCDGGTFSYICEKDKKYYKS